uniref:Alpha-carbonic anhydrase domain-containing protein n=1 Tax=Loa loa TaxID=7209 RepID=A0A1I7VLM5_LOALO
MIPWLMSACFYPCIIGPDFWGLVNKHWRMCTAGQLQSPINVDPSVLLYDPGLLPLDINKHQVQATLENMGQLPLVTINDSLIEQGNINISGGPSSPYRYRLHHVVVHFGLVANNERGSEHTIDRIRFPAEVQLLAYNTDLYANFTEAMSQSRGILAVSIIVDLGTISNTELRKLTVASQSITYKGTKTILKRFSAYGLLPQTQDYITYEGSLTFPGCFETVTWLQIWNDLQQTETKQLSPVLMSPNYRPLKPLNGRLLRTNINIRYKAKSPQSCPSNLYIDMGYKANPRRFSTLSSSVVKRSLNDNNSEVR